MIRLLLILLLALIPSKAASIGVTQISGLAAGSTPICKSGSNLVGEEVLSMTTDETQPTGNGFEIDPGTQRWYFVKTNAAQTAFRLDSGTLRPLTLVRSAVLPNTPSAFEVAAGAAIPMLTGNNITVIGAYINASLCTTAPNRCPKVVQYANDLLGPLLITEHVTNTMGGSMTNTAQDLSVGFYSLNRDTGVGNERMFFIPLTGITSIGGRAVAAGAANNAIATDSGNIYAGDATTSGRISKWSKSGPTFLTTLTTTCPQLIDSLLVVTNESALYAACNGGVIKIDLGTFSQVAAQTVGVSGVNTYNALAYDPIFRKLYLGQYVTGAVQARRLDAQTLAVEQTATIALATINTGSTVKNHTKIDPSTGRLYIAGNITGGTFVARFQYCQ